MVIIFWEFLMFYRILLSPQVKRSVIISNKHGIYELPHELPNNLWLGKLGKIRIISKLHKNQSEFFHFLLGFKKFAWQTKSAVALRYENFLSYSQSAIIPEHKNFALF